MFPSSINISGMNTLGGVPMFGNPEPGHPAEAQNGQAQGYRIPPVFWGVFLMVVGYFIARTMIED